MKTILIICTLFPILGVATWPHTEYIWSTKTEYELMHFQYSDSIEYCSNLIYTDIEEFERLGCDYNETNSYILNIKKWNY